MQPERFGDPRAGFSSEVGVMYSPEHCIDRLF